MHAYTHAHAHTRAYTHTHAHTHAHTHTHTHTCAQLDSFIHLHLGIDATGLPADLECHHLIVNSWDEHLVDEHQVCIVSIPTGVRACVCCVALSPHLRAYELTAVKAMGVRSPSWAGLLGSLKLTTLPFWAPTSAHQQLNLTSSAHSASPCLCHLPCNAQPHGTLGKAHLPRK